MKRENGSWEKIKKKLTVKEVNWKEIKESRIIKSNQNKKKQRRRNEMLVERDKKGKERNVKKKLKGTIQYAD